MKISRRQLFLGAAASAAVAAQKPSRRPRLRKAEVGRRFTGESLAEIAFPLGGIGTGTVSLGGFGNLRDWEIFNRPDKGGVLPFTFAVLRLAGALEEPVWRLARQRGPSRKKRVSTPASLLSK